MIWRISREWHPTIINEKVSKVGRLENGLVYLIRIFDQEGTWTVEMSNLSIHSQETKHSYIFSKSFDIDQVISESEHMYSNFIFGMRN